MKLHLALATLFLSACAICQAGTIYTVNETITLNPSLINTSGVVESYNQLLTGSTPVAVQPGDEITGTITFTNGPILLESPSGVFDAVDLFFTPVSGGGNFGNTGSLDFLGLTGTLGTSNPTPITGSGGGALLAQEFNATNTADFSFTGFTYKIDINSASPSPESFSFSQITLDAQTIAFGTTAASPTAEPSSLALMGLGCCALAFLKRPRRAWLHSIWQRCAA